ncbi:hypothetical protein H5410_032637, partial [Solanum commersonii]
FNMKDLLVDLMLHYGGKWITKPLLVYDEKYVATRRDTSADLLDYDKIVEEYTKNLGFVLVKQILVKGPFGKFYLLEGSEGIKTLQCLLNEQFKVVNFFAVDDFEETVFAPNIIHHSEAYLVECEYGTDAEIKSDDEYNFDELELIKMLKSKEVNADLSHYKELHPSMTFKDLNEARKIVNLYSLANSKPIVVGKGDRTRLRYKCMIGCPFVLLISQDGKGPDFKVKTLKINHNCEDAFKNPRACTSTLAQYFKNKLQNNPHYKLKDMRKDLMDQFNLNASTSKLKRTKRMALQKLQGSFLNDFNRIEAYANELRLNNPGSDIVINLSKDALEQGKRKFLRMYICFNALKLGWKEGLRPFIGLDGTFLKGQCNGQLLKLLWWAAWSTYEEDFKDQLSALGALSKSDAMDLLKYPPQTWCRAYLDTICKNQMVDNNFTESFNSWILEARGKPILEMLEDIRIKIMNRLREKEEDASKWTTNYSPKCMKLFTAYMRTTQLYSVDFNAIKRAGEWAHSRKGTKMTCSKCGETTHNVRTCNFVEREQGATLKRKRGRTEEESEEESEEEVEKPHGENYDVNSSAPRPTQDEEYHSMSSLQYEPFGPAREPESDPDIRPQVISEIAQN